MWRTDDPVSSVRPLGRFVRRHRSLVATAVSGSLVAAVVAGVAITSSGFTAQRMDLADGAVWVTNALDRAVGRANPEVLELNTVVRADGADLQVVQDGASVLVVDHADATVQILDPATATLGDAIALPPEQPEVHLGGGRVVVHATGTGEVWLLPVGELASFDATSISDLTLGRGTVLSVAPDGTLFAYWAETSTVIRVGETGEVAARWDVDLGAGDEDVEITSAGEHWAVLDPSARLLVLDGRQVDLAGTVPDGVPPVLQEPGPDADRLLIAASGALLAVPVHGGEPVTLTTVVGGAPAAPVTTGDCRFAAWTSGDVWRLCAADPAEGVLLSLAGLTGTADLDFRVNTGRVVLNDTRGGASWAVQADGELMDNWDELIRDDDQEEVVLDAEVPPEVDPEQRPPVAVDDEFGARPGRSTLLPVLLNDYDPNGDVLVIDSTTGIDEAMGRVDLVTRNQQLQVTLEPRASGTFGFSYTISDGRGGVATANVRVEVRGPDENSPPQQVRSTTAVVADGGRVTEEVLGDWVDPDGDPFYLAAASVAAPDQVSYQPDGTVVLIDAPGGGDLTTVTLSVTDGRARSGGAVAVEVLPAGQVPIVIEPWVAIATAGQQITVRPMSHVTGGNGPLRLNAVPERAGSVIAASFEAGTFTFESAQVGTHYLEFTVSDADATASGLVRIDVHAPPDANTRPITVPQTIFVTTLSSGTVDPTTTDIDPAGGVLVVTGVTGVDPGDGAQAEVLDQRLVRVTLTEPLGDRTVTFGYRVSNGLADAEGTITVVEIPTPGLLQPPLATDDAATVRVGDVVDIPVLDNDEQPEGRALTLDHELAQELPDGAGLLFASGDRLRYLAPDVAGDYVAAYTVRGPDGQTAQARVTISVREENTATNSPPVPVRVTARVLAGETVRIQIPLGGIDPDGDAVQLIGAASNPERGAVQSVESSEILYQAGEYSTGTDTFSYTVVDGLGARATGIVRVGISPRLDGARNPVATADEVTIRPGRTVSVRVLENDSDPDGSPLRVVSVEANSPSTVVDVVDERIVRITPPADPGTYGLLYTIANEFGGTSTNYVTVVVDPDAPLAYPEVADVVLAVSDVLELPAVDVAVLDDVFFADGEVGELGVALLDGYAGSAELNADKSVRVVVGDRSQIIPFAVIHPDDPAIRSFAFIWVPGYDDALPQVNRKAPPLSVASESTLEIEVAEYVVALDGSAVRLTDASTVRATHSDGDDLVLDEDTLVFTSADEYFGPASITFEVTDGSSATDPDARTAIITLPITVTPRENQPPVFVGAILTFEPGDEKELDLVRLTNYPYDDIDELAYTVLEPLPDGFSVVLNGQRLVLRAETSTLKGTSASVTLGVRDGINEGRAGRIEMQVVASTRPLAKPLADSAVTERGRTTVIDVLANDAATNPYPGSPLKVVAIRGIDGAALPEGVTIVPSADKSVLTVTVAPGAVAQDVSLQYQVADATLDPDRFVWGTVTISIQDVPDPVTGVSVVEFGDRLLRAAWTPGQFNNSPITEYRVTMTDAGSGDQISVTTCTTTVGCALTTPGNGPGHAVRLSVVAVNAIGDSASTAMAGQIWSDVIPAPPPGLNWKPLDQGLRVSWKKPADAGGSPVEQYVVTVGGVVQVISVAPSDPVGTTYAVNVQSPSIPNATAVAFSVSARNSAPNSLATWNQATGTGIPAGPPTLTGVPVSASGSLTDGASATAAWDGVFGDNGAAIQKYWAVLRSGGATPTCAVSGVESGSPSVSPPSGSGVVATTGTSAGWGGLSADVTYTLTVFAYNGQGCTAAAAVHVTPRAQPPVVTEAAISGAPIANGTGFWDFTVGGVGTGSGVDPGYGYIYRFSTGADGSQSGIRSGTSFLTAGTSHYGSAPTSVQFKACTSYPEATLCSATWSAGFPIPGVAVWNSEPGSLLFESESPLGDGVWSWTSAPSGAYTAVEYRCRPGDPWQPMPQVGSCQSGVVGANELRVRISANGATYDRSYDAGDTP